MTINKTDVTKSIIKKLKEEGMLASKQMINNALTQKHFVSIYFPYEKILSVNFDVNMAVADKIADKIAEFIYINENISSILPIKLEIDNRKYHKIIQFELAFVVAYIR